MIQPAAATRCRPALCRSGTPDYSQWLCADNNSSGIASRMATVLGVTGTDITLMGYHSAPNATLPCGAPPAAQGGKASRGAAFINSSTAIFRTQTQSMGNLFNGNEASARLDYNWNTNNRTFIQFNWFHSTDNFGPCDSACTRGFTNPSRSFFPNGQFSYVRTFSPTIVNEFRAGIHAKQHSALPPASPAFHRFTSTTALPVSALIAAIRSFSRNTTTAMATWCRSAMEDTA